MKTISRLTMMSVLSTMPLLLHAAPNESDNPTGPYVGGAVGQFNLHLEHLDDVDNGVQSIKDSDDRAWKAFAGYRFLPWLAVEAAYIDFGKPNDRFDATGSSGNYRVELSGFAPSLIASVPLGPVEVFAKVGQYYYDVKTRIDLDSPGPDIDTKKSGNDLLWGGGLSIVLAKHLELRAEYERIQIEDASDSDALWLGAAYRF